MKALLTTSALLALLATPALAQSDTAPMDQQPPAAAEPAPPMDAAPPPAATEQPVVPDAMTAPAPDTAAVPSVGDQMFVTVQATDEKLASNWIGKSLYNGADENVGDVNDLLFTQDGQVRAVIVGVGGFLGIGEKNVAINLDAIQPRTDEDGDVTLYINTTADALKAAPEFKTLADARAEMPADNAPPATQ
jgi:hypothetical protein